MFNFEQQKVILQLKIFFYIYQRCQRNLQHKISFNLPQLSALREERLTEKRKIEQHVAGFNLVVVL